MDFYNKEEANRAREAAVNKFIANDFAGARKFALKALSLDPEIVGITQMVATFAMHLAAQHTINGEVDHYGVLGVHPQADEETVKKRYKKLVVILHPDKNKSIGAGEAFKLVSKACEVLSDKEKRAEYDSKRNFVVCEGRGASSSSKKGAAKGKTPKRGVKQASDDASTSSAPPAPPAPAPPAPPALDVATTSDGTFWTVCSSCTRRYEYHRIYLNQNLRCSHCRKPFIAVETAPPHSSIRKTFVEHQFDSLEWSAVTTTGTITAAHDSQAVPRESTKRSAADSPSTNPPKRRKEAVVEENAAAAASNVASSSSAPPKSSTARDFSEGELNNVLVKKSKPIIVSNLQDLITIDPETEDVNMANASHCTDPVEDDTTRTDKDLPALGALTINVPEEPDVCDFGKNRTQKSFSDNEIWASYDILAGLPRVYYMIDKVLSLDPFKLCITRLTTSRTNSGPTSSSWLGSQRTCGVFRAGDSHICFSPYSFSHKMEAVKGDQGEFLIYPRTGEVWAMYRNWPSEWNYLEGNRADKYDVVEVVEGYTEEYGVRVVPLMKVAGFSSVFRHYLGPKEIISFSKVELAKFSHQIPSYLLTGKDAADELGGCRQLDPASTPLHLLEIVDG